MYLTRKTRRRLAILVLLCIAGRMLPCVTEGNTVAVCVGMLALVYLGGLLLTLFFVGPKQGFSVSLTGMPCKHVLAAFLCPCFAWARTARAVNPDSKWRHVGLMTALYLVFRRCFCCLGMFNRKQFRESRGIEGSVAQDCMIHAFAHPCALAQELHEHSPEHPICNKHKVGAITVKASSVDVDTQRFESAVPVLKVVQEGNEASCSDSDVEKLEAGMLHNAA